MRSSRAGRLGRPAVTSAGTGVVAGFLAHWRGVDVLQLPDRAETLREVLLARGPWTP